MFGKSKDAKSKLEAIIERSEGNEKDAIMVSTIRYST